MKRSFHAALPSLDSLIVFEKAADYLSFTKAGDHLGLTQSAVSRQMIDLEQLLQVKLFSRERQRLKLTSEGAEFREMVRPVLRDLRAATLRMQMRKAQSNVLNVSIAVSFCNLWFIANLPGYCALPGAAQINVMPHVGTVSFGAGHLDAAIVNSDRPPENCESIKLAEIEVAPYAAPSLLTRLGKSRLEEFDYLPALDLWEMREIWPRFLAAAGMPYKVLDYVGSQSLLLLNYEAAAAGLGVALLPPEFVPAPQQHGTLVRLHDQLLGIGRSYYYCWPSGSLKHQAVGSLGEWLQHALRESRRGGSRTASLDPAAPQAAATG